MIVIADECPLIRIGLSHLICNENLTDHVIEVDHLDALMLLCHRQSIRMLLFGLNSQFEEFLDFMYKHPNYFENTRILVLENRLNYTLFKKVRSMNIMATCLKMLTHRILSQLFIL